MSDLDSFFAPKKSKKKKSKSKSISTLPKAQGTTGGKKKDLLTINSFGGDWEDSDSENESNKKQSKLGTLLGNLDEQQDTKEEILEVVAAEQVPETIEAESKETGWKKPESKEPIGKFPAEQDKPKVEQVPASDQPKKYVPKFEVTKRFENSQSADLNSGRYIPPALRRAMNSKASVSVGAPHVKESEALKNLENQEVFPTLGKKQLEKHVEKPTKQNEISRKNVKKNIKVSEVTEQTEIKEEVRVEDETKGEEVKEKTEVVIDKFAKLRLKKKKKKKPETK
eukprot:maker-scaffold_78-snap-gene-0.0-mRNA-1 protein AED:0.00 eAED:0.00 QI:85/1/1/1/1/1/2/43/281